jgi:hypothetical protein
MRLTHTRLHALLLFFITAALCTPVAADDPEPATISGTVLEAGSGSPVADAIVVVTASGPRERLVAEPTDSSGEFSLEVPMGDSDTERDILVEAASPTHAPGRYNGTLDRLCFFGCGGFDGQFQVEAGQAVDNVDFDLEPGGRIAGTITETASGSVLENAYILLFHHSAPSLHNGWSDHFRPSADASGAYETALALPPGKFFVLAAPPPGANFVTQAWQGHACQLAQLTNGAGHGCILGLTDSVEVIADEITSAIDFALKPGATIEGTLEPDINKLVRLFNGVGQLLKTKTSFDSTGEWAYQGLAGGSYYMEFGPLGVDPHVRVLHNGLLCPDGGCERARGEPLSVAPASSLSGVDVTLELGGKLEGSLIDGDSGTTPPFEPAQWASGPVAVLDIIDTDGQVVGNANVLDDDGELKLRSTTGIPEGDYFIRTHAHFPGHGVGYRQRSSHGRIPGYADAIYDGQACAGLDCDLSTATPVTFEAGQTTEITLEITTGSDISGSVVDDSNDEPIPHAVVKLIDSSNETLAATRTDLAGEFTFGAFPAGDYYLRTGMASQVGFEWAAPGHAYFDRIYGASENCSEKLCDPATGDVISLDGDNDAGPLALRVEPGPVISGRIIDELTGEIINAGSVEVYDEEETLVGSYRINATSTRYQTTALPPGTYTLVPVVSPAFQATTQSSEPTASSVRTSRDDRTGSVSVTIGTESVEADMTVVDRSLNVIFHSGFEP